MCLSLKKLLFADLFLFLCLSPVPYPLPEALARLANQFGFQFLFSEPANAAAAAPSDFCANTWRGS